MGYCQQVIDDVKSIKVTLERFQFASFQYYWAP